jgi:hypothetical protein
MSEHGRDLPDGLRREYRRGFARGYRLAVRAWRPASECSRCCTGFHGHAPQDGSV